MSYRYNSPSKVTVELTAQLSLATRCSLQHGLHRVNSTAFPVSQIQHGPHRVNYGTAFPGLIQHGHHRVNDSFPWKHIVLIDLSPPSLVLIELTVQLSPVSYSKMVIHSKLQSSQEHGHCRMNDSFLWQHNVSYSFVLMELTAQIPLAT